MSDSKTAKRTNVLVLDGGGVRGLSSLLILQALMVQINLSLASLRPPTGELRPHHVFQLVAGTSTGGLIALMLGKMGMTVEECITKYEELSKRIFGKTHFWGRITHGLAPARYSGKGLRNCVRELLSDRRLDEDLPMRHEADVMACAVICREHCSSHKHSKLKRTAVPICSLPCDFSIVCSVCDAARATSAAPTFFPVMKIKDRYFADGGLGHNNPSFAIYYHYTGKGRRASTRPRDTSNSNPDYSPHGDLDCSRVRFTNIGTGAKVDEVESGKRERLAGLIPSVIREIVFLKQTLTDIAVNSTEKVEIMRSFQEVNPDVIMFERFDANHGLSNIKLDAHNALPAIRKKTELYLEEQATKDLLEEVGLAIATDYLNAQNGAARHTQAVDPAVGESHQRLDAPQVTTALPSLSTGASSHSAQLETESQGLSPECHEVQNGGTRPATKRPADTFSLPDKQRHTLHGAEDVPSIDNTGPELQIAADAAQVLSTDYDQ